MADDKTPDNGEKKPPAQIYRLTKVAGNKTDLKKLVTGGLFPDQQLPAGTVSSNAADPEDEYQTLYIGQANDRGILEPPYSLRRLDRLAQENNTLSPCIEAMVTNVDGTGYDFESKDTDADDDDDHTKLDELKGFFNQVDEEGTSFITLRKHLRRDLERTGNAYIEVTRNPADEIVLLKHVDAKMMRLVKKDAPVTVDVTLNRSGKDVTIKVAKRERRFVQLVNGVSLVYFKEFGASRDVNKTTGYWAPPNKRLPAADRGTEIIHLTCLPDSHTDYGVPRWISQLPSVLGSRKAEEFNLDFFDNGGIPPALIILQGGSMQSETRKVFEQKTQGSALSLNRIQVLEVEPSGGTMDKPTNARVSVERFGGDRANDSMFESYDDKCEERVRRAFRVAPLFLGNANDANFATAYISYSTTEAQVFKPERDHFDEIITTRLLPAMGYKDFKLVSKPLIIEDVNLKMEGLSFATTSSLADPKSVLKELNEATGLSLKEAEEKPSEDQLATHTVDAEGNIVPITAPPKIAQPVTGDGPPQPKTSQPAPSAKEPPTADNASGATKVEKTELSGITALAMECLKAQRERDFVGLSKNLNLVKSLDTQGLIKFRKALAELQFINPAHDVDGLGELAACTLAVMLGDCEGHKCLH